MAGRRVDEINDNVFPVGSRINSTWGGNLTDMVRARRILEVIEADDLFERAANAAATCAPGSTTRRRLPGPGARPPRPRLDVRVQPAHHRRPRRVDPPAVAAGVIVLPTGKDGVRFRPALTVSRAEIDERPLYRLFRSAFDGVCEPLGVQPC